METNAHRPSSVVGQIEIAPGAPAFSLSGLRVRAPDGREISSAADGTFYFAGLDPTDRVEVFFGDALIGAGRLDQPVAVRPSPSEAKASLSTGALHPEDAALLIELAGHEAVAPFLAAAASLSAIESLSQTYLATGEGSDALLDLLSREKPWSVKPPPRDRKAPAVPTSLALTAPGALPFAGALIESTIGLSDGRNRAITAFLRLAEPLARAVRTARAIADGEVPPKALLDLSEWAITVFDGSDIALTDLFRAGPRPWVIPSRIPPIPKGWWWLDPAHQAWAQCVFGIRPIRERPPQPPNFIFTVEPAAVCATAAQFANPLNFVLRGDFSNVDFDSWGLLLDNIIVTIVNKTANEVEVEVAGLRPGCHKFMWVWLKGGGGWFEDNVTAACSEALRIPLPSILVPPDWINPQPSLSPSLSVVAATIVGFTANGSAGPGLSHEACRPTILAWNVGAQGCDTSLIEVSLLRDGQVVAANQPLSSSWTEVREDDSNAYTLRVVVSDSSGTTCGQPLERSISVSRVKRLTLVIPPELPVGATESARVTRSCAAPPGGAELAVSISQPGVLAAPITVTILEGATEAEFQLTGVNCGPATLTVTAPDHTPASGIICVTGPPVLRTPINPAQFDLCAPLPLRLDLRCVGAELRVVLVAVSNGRRTPLSLTPPTGSCGADQVITAPIPAALPSGEYDVEGTDRGGKAILSRITLVPPSPTIRLTSPANGTTTLDVNFACSNGAPLTPVTISFMAVGDRVEITTGSGMQAGTPPVVVNRPSNTNASPCTEWRGEWRTAVPCSGEDITLEAVHASARSTPVVVNIRVNSTVQVDGVDRASRLVFKNASLLEDGRVSISIFDVDANGGPVFQSGVRKKTALSDIFVLRVLPGDPPRVVPFPLLPCREYSYTMRRRMPTSEPVFYEGKVFGSPCGPDLEKWF